MFYIIGLGLSDERDITVRGLEVVKRCQRVYLEAYTSILMVDKEKLTLIIADRELVETGSDDILADADTADVALLVVGDPLGATTHTDMLLRAKQLRIRTQIIHNASIMNAAGACGLQLYNFGQTVSLVFFTDNWRPDSFYDRLVENASLGLHTLLLLDIKVKEQSEENLARSVLHDVLLGIHELNYPLAAAKSTSHHDTCRFRRQCLSYWRLRRCESKASFSQIRHSQSLSPALAVVPDRERIVSGSLRQLQDADPSAFGEPLHSLVLVGKRLHPLESDYAEQFALDAVAWRSVAKDVYKCQMNESFLLSTLCALP
ncbi:Diphthine synthase [Auriculariales sp. MPI-PUGE-AT-0066]|nr:Diphthine synthase [Auriculariales sp. MPI-PUGE-AT-0066]